MLFFSRVCRFDLIWLVLWLLCVMISSGLLWVCVVCVIYYVSVVVDVGVCY